MYVICPFRTVIMKIQTIAVTFTSDMVGYTNINLICPQSKFDPLQLIGRFKREVESGYCVYSVEACLGLRFQKF